MPRRKKNNYFKTHLEVITQAPNESDTEGDGYILCGRDWAYVKTRNIKSVTCKHCRKIFKDRKKT